jgi:hypothetical protein
VRVPTGCARYHDENHCPTQRPKHVPLAVESPLGALAGVSEPLAPSPCGCRRFDH